MPFLCISDLVYCAPEDADLIKQHLLGKLQNTANLSLVLIRALEGIGRLIAKDDVNKLVDPLARVLSGGHEKRIENAAADCLYAEYERMSSNIKKAVIDRLNDWIKHYRNKGNEAGALKIQGLEESILIPF